MTTPQAAPRIALEGEPKGSGRIVHTVLANLRVHVAKMMKIIPESGHGGMCPATSSARIASPHGTASVYVIRDMGATPPGTWLTIPAITAAA